MTWKDVQGQVQNFQNVHFQLRGFLDRSKLTMNKDVAPSAFPWRAARRLLAAPPRGIRWRKRRCRWLWAPTTFYGSGIQDGDNPSVVWISILHSMVGCMYVLLAGPPPWGWWLWPPSIFYGPGIREEDNPSVVWISILQSMQWWSVRCVARRSSSRNLAAGRKRGRRSWREVGGEHTLVGGTSLVVLTWRLENLREMLRNLAPEGQVAGIQIIDKVSRMIKMSTKQASHSSLYHNSILWFRQWKQVGNKTK